MRRERLRKGVLIRLLSTALALLMIVTSAPVTKISLPALAQGGNGNLEDVTRLELDFSKDWKFKLGDSSVAHLKAADDSAYTEVDLPYDYSIVQDFSNTNTEIQSGNLPGGIGWYRKWFTMPNAMLGKRVILNFGYVFNNAYVYVNGLLVCENHYGYNAFSVDITDHIVYDLATPNMIAVKTDATIPSSRWYPGAGICGDVTMTIMNTVHVDHYGTKVTPNASTGAVSTDIVIRNDNNVSQDAVLNTQILDSSGNAAGPEVSTPINISRNSSKTFTVSNTATSFSLWDIDSPNLYTLRTSILVDNVVVDEYDTDFGYRTFNFSETTGFSLNGRNLKLKGVCLHHDNGALGAAQVYDALYRKLSIMKEMGVNAVRTSHNIPSKELIDICNKLGLLVMNEFFDGWSVAKEGNIHDFSEYFNTLIDEDNNIIGGDITKTWAQLVVEQTVLRDRNDPSVIVWSLGNELFQGISGDASSYPTIAAQLRSYITPLDNRPITVGSNRSGGDWSSIYNTVDIIGGNYGIHAWKTHEYPSKPFVATESASAVNSRNVYKYSYSNVLDNGVRYGADKQINSYDASNVDWGNTAADSWYYSATIDWWSGEFIWTGFDYIGEPTPWNGSGAGSSTTPNSSFFGIVDTAGFEKDTFYLYRALWRDDSTTLHLVPGTWDHDALGNKTDVPVSIYSNAAKVELFLNGNKIATATSTENTTAAGYKYKTWSAISNNTSVCTVSSLTGSNAHDLYPQFSVKYSAGTLSAKAYDSSNVEISNTVGTKSVSDVNATKIVSSIWNNGNNHFTADGKSYAYIELTAIDDTGNFDCTYNETITVTTISSSTRVKIIGVDNGNASTVNKYQQAQLFADIPDLEYGEFIPTPADRQFAKVEFFNGKALVIVQTTEDISKTETAQLTQHVEAGDLPLTGATFSVYPETGDELYDEYEERFPLEIENIGGIATVHDGYAYIVSLLESIEGFGSGGYDLSILNQGHYTKFTPSATGYATALIPSGTYIIANTNPATASAGSASLGRNFNIFNFYGTDSEGIEPNKNLTFDGIKLTTNPENEYTITQAPTGTTYNRYTVQNVDGKYLSIDATNHVTLTDTVSYVYAVVSSDNYVTFRNSAGDSTGIYLDYFSSENGTPFSAWQLANTAAANGNNKFTLYSKIDTEGKFFYDSYTPGQTVEDISGTFRLPTGFYAVTGSGTQASGVMSATTMTGGLVATNSYTISQSTDAWYFEQIGGTSSDTYNISVISNGEIKYLDISTQSGNITLSDTPVDLTVTADGDGYVQIWNNNTQLGLVYSDSTPSLITSANNTASILSVYPCSTSFVYQEGQEEQYTYTNNGTASIDTSARYLIVGTSGGSTSYLKVDGTTYSNGSCTVSNDEIKLPTDIYDWRITGTSNEDIVNDNNVYMNLGATLQFGTASQGNIFLVSNSDGTWRIRRRIQGQRYYYLGYTGTSPTWQSLNNTQANVYLYKLTGSQAAQDEGYFYSTKTFDTNRWDPDGVYIPGIEYGPFVILADSVTPDYLLDVSVPSSGYLDMTTDYIAFDTSVYTDPAYEYAFIIVRDNIYYIKSISTGKYLNIGTSNNQLTLSDTPQEITVDNIGNGQVAIRVGNQYLDLNTSSIQMSTYYKDPNQLSSNNQFWLKKKNDFSVSDDPRFLLYQTLTVSTQYLPGEYTDATYAPFLDDMYNGVMILQNSDATDEQVTAVHESLLASIENLKIALAKFDGALYRYGYNPTETGTARYDTAGGYDYSVQSIWAMKQRILADPNLVAQITATLQAAKSSWNNLDAAVDAAAEYYARLYTLCFIGIGTAGGIDKFGPQIGLGASPITVPSWNYWLKANSIGVEDNNHAEGASVVGLFSDTLDPTALVPYSHALYEETMPYHNTDTEGPTAILSNITVNLESTNVTLPPLSGISVYAPDFFSKNNVPSGLDPSANIVTGFSTTTTSEYSKFYWETDIPFRMRTDETCVNYYCYDSSDQGYIYRTYFDDANNTAICNLQKVDNWTLNLSTSRMNYGMFPFNYQMTEGEAKGTEELQTSFNGENAIYHFGLSMNTTFSIPSNGKYKNGEDVMFKFSGDDDVLLYVDGKLVVDNGGIHGARKVFVNFTECTITYQFLFDPFELNTAGSDAIHGEYVTFRYGEEFEEENLQNGMTEDIRAALQTLNDVLEDPSAHTLHFFYLERGSSLSNCRIEFNIQPSEGLVKVRDQELVADYGLNIDYDITENNSNYDSTTHYKYLGIVKSIDPATDASKLPDGLAFAYNTRHLDYEFGEGKMTYTDSGEFGSFTATLDKLDSSPESQHKIDTHFELKDMQFTSDQSYYVIAQVFNDPIFTKAYYYTYEKITYIPATTIYYEDNFVGCENNGGITYTDGTGHDSFGKWRNVTDASIQAATNQAADVVGSADANHYDYDPNYANFATFSNASTHVVSVSDHNNTRNGGSWPKAQFTFAGTGFDVISVTSRETGTMVVRVTDANDAVVAYRLVDTYYGYSYGQIYLGQDGQPTLDAYTNGVVNGILYRNEKYDYNEGSLQVEVSGEVMGPTKSCLLNGGGFSYTPHYYDTDGNITDEVHYIDDNGDYTTTPYYIQADGTVSTNVTDNPNYSYAYAFGYGWIITDNVDENPLYQIPVMKIDCGNYGVYNVTVEPRFTSYYGHYLEQDGTKYFDVYLDAVRIYNPAGAVDNVLNKVIKDAYYYDDENNASRLKLKDVLIGADSITDSGYEGSGDYTLGAIYIDGNAVLGEDLETYRQNGPNNELYLDGGQAVAFQIVSTVPPADIQIGAKLAKGSPKMTIYNGTNYGSIAINTATDMNYSLYSLLPESACIKWTPVIIDDNVFYTSGTIVIENDSLIGNILSITDVKWTFNVSNAYGYFYRPSQHEKRSAPQALDLAVNSDTDVQSKSLLMMRGANLDIDDEDVTVENPVVAPGEQTVINITTSSDVNDIRITDQNGNIITADELDYIIIELDGREYKEWTVSITQNETGTFTYDIVGVYENGYYDTEYAVTVTVTVENVETTVIDEETGEEESIQTLLQRIIGVFAKIRDFFTKLFETLRTVFK